MILLRPQRPQISYQMIAHRPLWASIIECPDQRRVVWQLLDEDTQPTRRHGSAVEVEQVDAIETEQVSLYRVALLMQQVTEAS